MVLLILGDSQVERIWPSVRLDREVLRDALFFPVKNRSAILSGFNAMTASVRIHFLMFDFIIVLQSACHLFIVLTMWNEIISSTFQVIPLVNVV